MRQYSDVPSPRQVEAAREPCVSNSFAAMSLSPRPFPDARVFSKFNSGDLKLYRTGPKKWLCSFARLCGSYLSMYGTEEVRAAGKGSADRIIRRPYFCAHMRQTFDQLQAFSEGDCKRLRTSNIAGARSVW